MDGDRPQQVRTVEAHLALSLPAWVVVELELYATERPDQTVDRFVSDLIRQWASTATPGGYATAPRA